METESVLESIGVRVFVGGMMQPVVAIQDGKLTFCSLLTKADQPVSLRFPSNGDAEVIADVVGEANSRKTIRGVGCTVHLLIANPRHKEDLVIRLTAQGSDGGTTTCIFCTRVAEPMKYGKAVTGTVNERGGFGVRPDDSLVVFLIDPSKSAKRREDTIPEDRLFVLGQPINKLRGSRGYVPVRGEAQ